MNSAAAAYEDFLTTISIKDHQPIMWIEEIQYLVIDLFCGAGGTTIGFEEANFSLSKMISKVIACVNHDHLAIKSHWSNHPDVEHFEEDITKLYGYIKNGVLMKTPSFQRLVRLVEMYRAFYPDAKVIIWASLECTNFSKAKGGLPRDADSRTLAHHLAPYIYALDPDYIKIENVVEFMSWGPLDEKGKPISRKKGQDWLAWREFICRMGYHDEWREINSADYGAFTSRNRLFGCFAKSHLTISWPTPTHAKVPAKDILFGEMKKWEPVKKVLDFEDEGLTVFNRQKKIPKVRKSKKGYLYCRLNKYDSVHKTFGPVPDPLSPKTMKRLFNGCVRHIAGGMNEFIAKVNSSKEGFNGSSPDQAMITANFLQRYYSGDHQTVSIESPSPVLRTKDCISKVQAEFFIDKQYSGQDNHQSIDRPAGSLMPNDKHVLINAEKWLMNTNFNNVGSSLNDPSPVITADRHHHYLINPSWGGNPGSIDQPCPVVIARQDKAPLSFVTCVNGAFKIPVYETDCEWTIKLKGFMALYGICDIKMRMLKVIELIKIQGFPVHYILLGTLADQKKFIGNAVHPLVPKAWIRAMSDNNIKIAA